MIDKVFRYEDSLASITDVPVATIFLAGPTVRGNQPHLTSWRFAAIDEFKKQGYDGYLIAPEFIDKKESDKGKEWIPAWEFAGLTGCDVIMFWIPRTKELIGLTTNHEMGYWLAQFPKKVIYGRPDDSYRNTYLDIMWNIKAKQHQIEGGLNPICKTLEETVTASIALAKTVYPSQKPGWSNRNKSLITVDSPYGKF